MEKRTRVVHMHGSGKAHLGTEFTQEEHAKVVQLCEDVPETPPLFPFPINKVGITEKTVWIRLQDGLIPFEASIFVDLPPEFKGIHMSRMEQSISELFDRSFKDICEYTCLLSEKILEKQRGKSVEVTVSGKIPLPFKTTISNLLSVDCADVSSRTILVLTDGTTSKRQATGLGLTHITACPCTQAYNRELFKNEAGALPYPTHSQRCQTWLEVETADDESVTHEELFKCLTSCLHMSQDLLKRPDEAELVLKSHREAQFAEDVVRMVAREAASRFKHALSYETVIKVSTKSLESIHTHNVSCFLEAPLGDIIKQL